MEIKIRLPNFFKKHTPTEPPAPYVPPPISPELQKRLDTLQHDATDARKLKKTWDENRAKSSQIAPDIYQK